MSTETKGVDFLLLVVIRYPNKCRLFDVRVSYQVSHQGCEFKSQMFQVFPPEFALGDQAVFGGKCEMKNVTILLCSP